MNFTFINYRKEMNILNGLYNAKYNGEPSLIKIDKGVPVYVTFLGFIKNGESRSSAIFDPKGVLHSSVELLVPSQTF